MLTALRRALSASFWTSSRKPKGVEEPRPASLAYLTFPEPGMMLLNLQFDSNEFLQARVSREQLANIVVDGAVVLLRRRPQTNHGETK